VVHGRLPMVGAGDRLGLGHPLAQSHGVLLSEEVKCNGVFLHGSKLV